MHESPPSALRVVGSRSLVTLALYTRQRSVPRATRCWSAQGWRILQDRLIYIALHRYRTKGLKTTNVIFRILHRQPNTKCLLHLLRTERSIYFVHHHVLPLSVFFFSLRVTPCLFFRNTVRSASSCFGARQDHYGARGLWPDHARARGLLARPLRARGLAHHSPTTTQGLHRSLVDLCSGTASTTLRPLAS